MQITNYGRGVHKREIKGIERFKLDLPRLWYGFSNLDIILGPGKSREIDLILVSDLRIFLIDLKDWHGRIETDNDRWRQDGKDRGPSPVAKIVGIAREIRIQLGDALKRRPETRSEPVPTIEGLVVMTGSADCSGITGAERQKVFSIDDFIKILGDDKKQRTTFGNVAPQLISRTLVSPFWKEHLNRFFGVNSNPFFKPGLRRFQGYVPEDAIKFRHPTDIYAEYDASLEGNTNNLGTLRLWDFSRCPDGRFQTEEGRLEIAGREQQVFHWLRDRDGEIERSLLTPRLEDPERSVHYWEIYDRRRRMQRLGEFCLTEGKTLPPSEKIELARQTLSAVVALHRHGAAHLDLGGHSVWLEAPTSVKLSHLLAARYPEARSLGESRFQFLASVALPEDCLGVASSAKRRDVFLTGVAIHQLLFGSVPSGDPAEWNPSIDPQDNFSVLHDWFAEALEVDPAQRFEDAAVALKAFNKATAVRPTPEEVIAGLDQFRNEIRSQRQLATAYPTEGEPFAETDRFDMWRSSRDGVQLVVKLWKQAAWGDLRREGRSILAFLKKAADIKADRPNGLPLVREVIWLGDAMVVAQDWIEGDTLEELTKTRTGVLETSGSMLGFLRKLIDTVEELHARGLSHGDIAPSNIIVTPQGDPVLIDALDFSPSVDGDKRTFAYSVDSANRPERDRYALTKIAEEMAAGAALDPGPMAILAAALRDCQEKEPALSTLLPLREAIDAVLNAPSADSKVSPDGLPSKMSISAIGAALGPIESDEGFLFLRARNTVTALTLTIRGAYEELEIRVDNNGKPYRPLRRKLAQARISSAARQEFHKISTELTVVRGDVTELSDLLPLLQLDVVKNRFASELGHAPIVPATEDDVAEAPVSEDQAEDLLAEEIAVAPVSSATSVDVPLLWRTLIDVENELTTEGVAVADSFFDRKAGRHKVQIDLETGVFDFAREDTVAVHRQDKKGWRRIGELDTQLSKPELAVIYENETAALPHTRIVSEGQRLKFISHFESMSLRRRTDAVDRILAGNGRSGELLKVFDPRTGALPKETGHDIDQVALDTYDLNDDQQKAFRRIVRTRPVGVLQGPPGTGKTRFIAALTHYAITKGLARNVLLASQAHEAVNTAAEAVLSLFRKTGGSPSLLRVGMNEDVVSAALRPYHTARVEQSFKDKFKAAFRERMIIAGQELGLPEELIDDVTYMELTVRPIATGIGDLMSLVGRDEKKINSLVESLNANLAILGLADEPVEAQTTDWLNFLDWVTEQIISKHADVGASADRIKKLRSVAAIGRDFVGSVSQRQRSFDTFLAGTRQIVAGTCVGLGRTSLGLTSTAFDLVIVDEAARCTSSELLVPLQAARWVVLVGDHAQLEPHHEPEIVNQVSTRTAISKREIQRSDFERLFTGPYGQSASCTLKTQYRMWPPIGELVSGTFYPRTKLAPGRSVAEIEPHILPPGLGQALTWIETDGLGTLAYERREDQSSRINMAEADAIMALLDEWHSHEPFKHWLSNQDKHPAGIGIICMYAAQRDVIERKLRQSPLGYLLERQVKVGTVDSYQGKENPIVVLSLVRNNDLGPLEGGARRIQVGFLAKPNRINVAVSRAMDRLIIVGARKRWPADSPVAKLVVGFETHLSKGAASIISAESVFGSASVASDSGNSKVTKLAKGAT